MAAVEIHSCNCKHEHQDRLYGEGQRVFNVAERKKLHQETAPNVPVLCAVLLNVNLFGM